MSDVITNMKVRFGADTKNFKKGLDEGKQSTKQFEKDAGSAFDSFAAAFGINMGQVRQGLDKVKTSLSATTTGFKSAAASSSIFSRALGILKTAIIATGIGALIVALGSLVTYFTKTERGAEFVERVMHQIGAVTNVLIDRISALGEKIFKAFSNPKKAISDLWEAIKTNIVNRFEALIDLFRIVGSGLEAIWKRDMKGLKSAAIEAGNAIFQMTTGLDESQQKKIAAGIKGLTDEIKNESQAALGLERRLQALEDKEIALIEIQAKRRKEINEARLLAEDENVSAEKRLAAMERAQSLEQQTLKENIELQKERISVMQQEIDLGESMDDDYRALAEEKAKLQDIESESLRLQRRLKTEINSLTNEIESQTAEIIKNRKAQTEWAKPIQSIGLDTSALKMPQLETDKLLSRLSNDLGQAKNIILDFTDVFNRSFENMAEGFATNLGNMLAGTGNIKNFGNIVKEAFGDMAVSAGRIIVKAGIAFFAIGEALRKAIKTPAAALAAIAAGAALIAVGKAAQASLDNVAGGGSGSIQSNSYVFDTRGSSSVFSTSMPSGEAQTVNVNVTGEFVQKGSVMVATINETNKRARYQ